MWRMILSIGYKASESQNGMILYDLFECSHPFPKKIFYLFGASLNMSVGCTDFSDDPDLGYICMYGKRYSGCH